MALKPGERVSLPLVWDGRDSQGRLATPGWYGVLVQIAVDGREMGMSAPAVLIQHPQGALEAEVAVGQKREAKGVEMTLERVSFTRREVKIEALAMPPGYRPNLQFGPTGAPHVAVAEVYLDDGTRIFAGGAGNKEEQTGIRLVWTLDPLPASVKGMRVVVSRLDDWEGPWEWQVSLR